MACFIVPGAEAAVVTAAALIVKHSEKKKLEAPKLAESSSLNDKPAKIRFSRKLFWLCGLLWGGVLLLAFEHFWHGEIIPTAPFLTAMYNPEDISQMLHEMATVGVAMAASVTAIWGVICAVADAKYKKVKAKLTKKAEA